MCCKLLSDPAGTGIAGGKCPNLRRTGGIVMKMEARTSVALLLLAVSAPAVAQNTQPPQPDAQAPQPPQPAAQTPQPSPPPATPAPPPQQNTQPAPPPPGSTVPQSPPPPRYPPPQQSQSPPAPQYTQ